MTSCPVLDLGRPGDWPAPLRAALDEVRPVFHAWLTGSPDRKAALYDRAHARLHEALQPYALVGWHLTRLLDHEVDAIRTAGLQVLSTQLLEWRISEAQSRALLDTETVAALQANHHANKPYRAGQLWFGFTKALPGEQATNRLLRYWGGEALYIEHEDDSATAAVLCGLGRPAIVDAVVPIAWLRDHSVLEDEVARADLVHEGLLPYVEPGFESYSRQPIPAQLITGITRWPEPDFCERTRCEQWDEPLS